MKFNAWLRNENQFDLFGTPDIVPSEYRAPTSRLNSEITPQSRFASAKCRFAPCPSFPPQRQDRTKCNLDARARILPQPDSKFLTCKSIVITEPLALYCLSRWDISEHTSWYCASDRVPTTRTKSHVLSAHEPLVSVSSFMLACTADSTAFISSASLRYICMRHKIVTHIMDLPVTLYRICPHAEYTGFWRWCITLRIAEFMDSAHFFKNVERLEIAMFRKLDLLPSSVERRETLILSRPLRRANLNWWTSHLQTKTDRISKAFLFSIRP
jgi:hypothetical protein